MTHFNKAEIMKRAWEIAELASKVHGGTKKEYFSASLKQAWLEAKTIVTSSTVLISIEGGKTYTAKEFITREAVSMSDYLQEFLPHAEEFENVAELVQDSPYFTIAA